MLFPDRSPHLMREHKITWLTSRFFGFLTRKQNSLTASDVKRWRHFEQRHIHDTHAHNLQCTCEGQQLLEEFVWICSVFVRWRLDREMSPPVQGWRVCECVGAGGQKKSTGYHSVPHVILPWDNLYLHHEKCPRRQHKLTVEMLRCTQYITANL